MYNLLVELVKMSSRRLYLIPSTVALVIFLHLNLHSYTANKRKGKNQKNLKDFIYVRNNLHFPSSSSHGSCIFHKSHKVKFHYIIQFSIIVPKDHLNTCKVFYYLIICFFVFYLDYLHYPLFLFTLMIILVTRNYYHCHCIIVGQLAQSVERANGKYKVVDSNRAPVNFLYGTVKPQPK